MKKIAAQFKMFRTILGIAGVLVLGASCNGLISDPQTPDDEITEALKQNKGVVEISLPLGGRVYTDVGLTLEDVKHHFDYYEAFCIAGSEVISYGRKLAGADRLVVAVDPGTYDIVVLGGTSASGNLTTGEKVLLATGKAENQLIEVGKINTIQVLMSPITIAMQITGIAKGKALDGSVAAALAAADPKGLQFIKYAAIARNEVAKVAYYNTAAAAATDVIPAKNAANAGADAAIAAVEAVVKAADAAYGTATGKANPGSIDSVIADLPTVKSAANSAKTDAMAVTTLASAQDAADDADKAANSDTDNAMDILDDIAGVITSDIAITGITTAVLPEDLPVLGQKGGIRYVQLEKGNITWAEQKLTIEVKISDLANVETVLGAAATFTSSEGMIRSLSTQEFSMSAIPLESSLLTGLTVGGTGGVLNVEYTISDTDNKALAVIPESDAAGRFYFNLKLPVHEDDPKLAQWNIRNRLLWDSTEHSYFGGGIVFLFGNAATAWVEIDPVW